MQGEQNGAYVTVQLCREYEKAKMQWYKLAHVPRVKGILCLRGWFQCAACLSEMILP